MAVTPHAQAIHALLTAHGALRAPAEALSVDGRWRVHRAPEVQFIPSNTRAEERSDDALVIGQRCLCRAEGAAYALTEPKRLGIRGGTTAAYPSRSAEEIGGPHAAVMARRGGRVVAAPSFAPRLTLGSVVL